MGGIINGGWKLVYDERPSEYTKAMEKTRDEVDARFSIGLALNDKGEIRDVIMNSPAWKAGIAPGSILLAVNGRKYTPDILRDALAESKAVKRRWKCWFQMETFTRSTQLIITTARDARIS